MTLQIGEMTIIEAFEDGLGWRPEMDAAETTTGANGRSGPSVNLPVVAVLKAGMVRLVRSAKSGALEHQLVTFPAAAHDDLVDAMVHGLLRVTGGGPVERAENPFYRRNS